MVKKTSESRAVPKTDISRLTEDIRGKPYRQAFPGGLAYQCLLQIARDLRTIELMMAGDTDQDAYMEGPVLVTLHLLQGRIDELGLDATIGFSPESFARWFQLFQFVVEREMVTRIIGIETAGDDEVTLLAALDEEIDQATGTGK